MDGFSILIGVLGALATVGSTLALYLKSRGENKNAATHAKVALDSLIDQRVSTQLKGAWTRLDEQDEKLRDQNEKIDLLEARDTRRMGAITRILRAIAHQWPSGTSGPDLNPMDISEIEETIPAEWIRKHPRTK